MKKRGRDIILDVLRSEGVTHIFGNPGTTELSLMDALLRCQGFKYVLALQEATAVAMAEGYARATNRPAFLNLHATAGLGNGLGALSNAAYTGVPLVVTAGQQDYRHIIDEPWLTGDLVGIAKPLTKWAHEVRTVDEIGPILRRALKDANSYPKGPVFVALPSQFMDEEVASEAPARSFVSGTPIASGLDFLAAELLACDPGELAIIACDEIAFSDALAEVVQIAETLGADVYGAPVHDSVVFPTAHPLWITTLPPAAAVIRETLARYRKVFVIGDRGFMTLTFSGSPVPAEVDILHLSADPGTVARTYSTRCGVVGDIRNSLTHLRPLLGSVNAGRVAERIRQKAAARSSGPGAMAERALAGFSRQPIPPETVAYAIVQALPPGALVVDEAPSITRFVREFHRTTERLQYNFSKGGGLGWAMPVAVGIALARPERRTVCLVGDGAAMYCPQALWSAAREKLPVTFIVVNNTEYGVLKNFLRENFPRDKGKDEFVGMDISDPAIDFQALARSMGVKAVRVTDANDIGAAIESANRSGGPKLIEVVMAPSGSAWAT